MYKIKPIRGCEMPSFGGPISVLVLNASLKHEPGPSNTGELADLVIKEMKNLEPAISEEKIRLADKNIPVGLGFKESDDDDWPSIVEKVRSADIILFATPVWWGGRSSLMQRIIERMDALDEEYIRNEQNALYNKVAGIVITGSEDGALSTMGSIMTALTWFGFTLPPECAAYWVGEVGQPTSEDAKKRRENKASQHMAKNLARNLIYYAQLLKQHPLTMKKS